MGLRTTDLELLAMNRVSKELEKLPPEARERVVNWLAAKAWQSAGQPASSEAK
jgi:hypothetical protein